MLQVRTRLIALLSALAFVCVGVSSTGADDSDVVIDITKPQRSRYPIAVPAAASGDRKLSKEIAEIATFDLSVAGWFRVLDPRSFLADLKGEGLSIQTQKWKDVGAFGVMKYEAQRNGGSVTIDFRLYEVEQGDEPVLSRKYRGSVNDTRRFTHMWCNEVVKHFTGEDGFFGSQIAFTAKHRRGGRNGRWSSISVMDFDGHNPHAITRVKYINILPAFSRDGSRLAFTSYMRDNPDLYVVSKGGGRPRRISKRRGMNTGASFSPDGSKIALTLSKDGNPEIYVISASSGKILRRLTRNRAIDTSPAWSPDGREIAFVSDREGGPQIFVMSSSGGNLKRVSFNGSYNTTPTWAPRSDKRMIAYTTRGASGNFDIVTLDLDSGAMVRVTQKEGNNEEPSFSPNGRAIAFARTGRGSGIFIASVDGKGDAVQVYKGSATSLDWGPAP